MPMLFIAVIVFGVLTGPQTEQIETHRRQLKSRLKSEPLSFLAERELFEFADRITSTISGPARAEFELYRMRALARSVQQVMGYEPKDPAMREWIKKHEDTIVFSEPAGAWLVDAEEFWKLEAKHRGNRFAEEIAWEAARTGLPSFAHKALVSDPLAAFGGRLPLTRGRLTMRFDES